MKNNNNTGAYYKVLTNKVLRSDGYKFQLFDEDFNSIWDINIDELFDINGYNMIFLEAINIVSDDENIYVSQIIKEPVEDSWLSVIIVIDFDRNIKRIKLNKDSGLSKITNIETINDRVVITEKTTTPKTPTSESHIRISSLYGSNYEVEKVLLLPLSAENSNVNLDWNYVKSEGGKLYYTAYYYESSSYEVKKNYEYKHFLIQRIIGLNTDLEIVSDTIIDKGSHQKLNNDDFYTKSLNYNEKKYTVLLNDIELNRIQKKNKDFGYKSIKVNNVEILPQIKLLFNRKPKKQDRLEVIDIIEDPINESVNIFVKLKVYPNSNYTAGILTFDKDYNLSRVSNVYFDFSSYIGNLTGSFILTNFDFKGYTGELPEGYKPNAFDFAFSLDGLPHFYVINYDDYQLLFAELKGSDKFKVYKIIR